MSELAVGGLTPLTSTDFPGQLAAVVFCQGCPWRCGYCHNPHLIPRQGPGLIQWSRVEEFLQCRRGLLDAVVLSGGEPTLQSGLLGAVKQAKNLDFKVGLHTGGPYPSRLAELLPWLDWVGMDIKASIGAYERITHTPGSGEKAMQSARLILESGVAYEFRTTVHPSLISRETLYDLAKSLAGMGVRNYVLQEFRPTGCADSGLSAVAVSGFLDEDFCATIRPFFGSFEVRRA